MDAKKVIITITGMSLDKLSMGLEIRLTKYNTLVTDIVFGDLPPLPEQLLAAYENWKQGYLNWCETHRHWQNNPRTISTPISPVETNISIDYCGGLKEKLIMEFNNWLDIDKSLGLSKIAQNLLPHVLSSHYRNSPELLSIIVQIKTSDSALNLDLQKLPWNEWTFIQNNYENEVALSTNTATIIEQKNSRLSALVICGDYRKSHHQIDLQPDLDAIRKNLGNIIELEIWISDPEKKSKHDLLIKLDQSTHHLLFFCGHSSSNNQLQLNEQEYLSIDDTQFQKILTKLRDRGLILAFFNSCDGLGIASSLMSKKIPYVVVMKELIHDRVAQEFIGNFLEQAIRPEIPIHIAVNKARTNLHLLKGLPHGELLPVLFQNPEQPPLYLNPKLTLTADDQSEEIPILPKLKPSFFLLKSRKVKYFIIAAVSATAILICAAIPSVQERFWTAMSLPICKFADENENISCGEEILLVQPGGEPSPSKTAGFKLIQKDLNNPLLYSQAIQSLKDDWDANHDPETAIASENAKLAFQISQNATFKVKNIAIVVPTKTNTPFSIADSLLKGIAYAQQQHNRENKDWKLRVIIANDGNSLDQAQKIASLLANRTDILGVIGHYSSYITVPIVRRKIYDDKVVLISATSTSHELTSPSGYFFRLAPSSIISAKDMAKRWIKPDSKMIVFYRPDRDFSNSLTKKFESEIKKASIIKKVDLAGSDDIAGEIKKAKGLGANAIVLFPDAYTGEKKINDRAAEILKYNDGEMPILGNTSIYDLYDDHSQSKSITVKPKIYKNVVITIPWDYQDTVNGTAKYPEKLVVEDDSIKYKHNKLPYIPNWWLTDVKSIGSLNERIAMSYDASLVLIKALNKDEYNLSGGKISRSKSEDRLAIHRILRDPDFFVEGITGRISFNGSDRKEEMNSLVTPNCDEIQCNGLKPYRK